MTDDKSLKMIRNSKEKELPTKQEGGIGGDDKAPPSSRLWSAGLRNPRIVRVSRAFGGKDRHSKVSTVRGLRDRRVRLSVPTAIQLYDLQDRLGLNQPSKVVDWLLNASQHEIDKLPPLQMPPGNFIQFSQPSVIAREETPSKSPSNSPSFKNTGYLNDNGAHPLALLSTKANNGNMSGVVAEDLPTLYWNNSDASQRTKQRELILGFEKGNIMKGNGVVEDHDPLLKSTHSSVLGLLSNGYHWGYANEFSSNLGIHPPQMDEARPIQSSLSLSTGSQSMLPSYMIAPADFDARQSSYFQMVSPASQSLPSNPIRTYIQSSSPIARSFYSNLTSKHQDSQSP